MKLCNFVACLTALSFGIAVDAFGEDIEQAVIRCLSGTPGLRTTGEGVFVHKRWQKAINEQEWLAGIAFANDAEREVFKRRLRSFAGANLSLDVDSTEYQLIHVVYDSDGRVREDRLSVDEREAAGCTSAEIALALLRRSEVERAAYDGRKTVRITRIQGENGKSIAYAITASDKPYVLPFQSFGTSSVGSKTLLDQLRGGVLTLSGYTQNNLVHAKLDFRSKGNQIRLAIDPLKDYSLVQFELGVGDVFLSRSIWADYSRTGSGQWFPFCTREEKLAQIGGSMTLLYSDEYRAVPDTIDFDLVVHKDMFALHAPEGMPEMDLTADRPTEGVGLDGNSSVRKGGSR